MLSNFKKGKRAVLVAFEGCDRSGKTTQCSLLCENLSRRGYSAIVKQFPDRSTPLGQVIDRYLKGQFKLNDRAVHLLFTSNRWECFGQLEECIRTYDVVILDRYTPSGTVFSMAKGIQRRWAQFPEVGLPKPDCVIFLDLKYKNVSNRSGFGQELYEQVDFQERVYELYKSIMDDSWIIVDGYDKNKDELGPVIMEHVLKLISRYSSEPLGYYCLDD